MRAFILWKRRQPLDEVTESAARGIDTPKDTPSKRWLLRDIGGCQFISRLSRGLLVDTQASAGQAWLSAIDPQGDDRETVDE
jgi:hypothetical protein